MGTHVGWRDNRHHRFAHWYVGGVASCAILDCGYQPHHQPYLVARLVQTISSTTAMKQNNLYLVIGIWGVAVIELDICACLEGDQAERRGASVSTTPACQFRNTRPSIHASLIWLRFQPAASSLVGRTVYPLPTAHE
jgi:hypothetical protein